MDAADYWKVKEAILWHHNISEETYRQPFQSRQRRRERRTGSWQLSCTTWPANGWRGAVQWWSSLQTQCPRSYTSGWWRGSHRQEQRWVSWWTTIFKHTATFAREPRVQKRRGARVAQVSPASAIAAAQRSASSGTALSRRRAVKQEIPPRTQRASLGTW